MDINKDDTREESAWSWDKFTKRSHNLVFNNTMCGNSKLVVNDPGTILKVD